MQKTGRLITIVFLFCSVLLFLVWWQILHQVATDRKETIAAAVQKNSNLAVSLEQYAIRTIRNADALLHLVKMEYERMGNQIDLNELLDKGVIDVKCFNDVAILDEKGNILKSNLRLLPEAEPNFSDKEYFYFHQTQKDQLYISKPIVFSITKKAVIVFSRRIDKPDGSFGGTVTVQVEPSTFMQFYANANLKEDEIISLIAPDGITYARRRGSRESFGEDISKSELFQLVAKKPVSHYYTKDAIRGIESYFSYRKLADYPVIATVGSAKKDVLADYMERAERDYLFGISLTILITLLFCFVCVFAIQRRKSTRELKDSETRYRSIFENSQDAIIVALGNGQIEAMNPAGCRFFGVSQDQLHTLTLNQLFINAEPYIRMQEGKIRGVASHDEILFMRGDNSTFTGEIVYSDYVDVKGIHRFIVLLRDITLRKQMERKLLLEQKRYDRKLTKQIILAQERERERIGYELHDNINQILTSVKLYLEMAIHQPEVKKDLLPRAMQFVMNCISEIRNISRTLSAPTLGTQSLIDSIKALVETVESSSRMAVSFTYVDYHTQVAKDQKLAIYRILQEVLNNIIKHAGAKRVDINLSQTEEITELTICDNGKGFDASVKSDGIGLNNIQSRIKVFGGDLFIDSKAGQGCRITVKLPIKAEDSISVSQSTL